MIDKTIIGETERLILRHITLADAEDMFYGWANDPRVTEHVTWKPHKDIEETKSVISRWIEQYAGGKLELCIELKETGKVIGSLGVHDGNPKIKSISIGYCLSHAYWNKGIMTEAVKAMCNYLFSQGHNRIEAVHHTGNPASGKVMLKAGMQYEGIKRQGAVDSDGNLCDVACYAILKDDLKDGENI
jgi:ribosomal-protein-alanine N-acetyltransferase